MISDTEGVAKHFQYQRLPITCRYLYEDGTVISGYAEKEKFAEEIAEKTTVDKNTILIALQHSAFLYDAPEGCENWFTMINIPNNSGQDWDALIDKARTSIIRKVNHILITDLSALIETEAVLDPRLIEQKTSSAQGALYGNSSNNRYAAFLRHANFSSKLKGLYFCGGSVHPGGGIPLCLLSAKIVADLMPVHPSLQVPDTYGEHHR